MNADMSAAYLRRDPTVLSWFDGFWEDIENVDNWKGLKHSWQRSRIVQMLLHITEQQGQQSPITLQHIKDLGQEDCFAVVAGQQPALGGGPLYSLIKAAQCVALCQQLQSLGVKAVPIFWCASEDHDEGEANHADFLTEDGEVSRINVPFDKAGSSLHFQSASSWWPTLIQKLENTFGSAIGQSWFNKCEPLADESTGHWFCRLLSHIFSKQGLICIEAYQLRPLWHPHLTHLVDHWPSLPLAKRRKEIMDAGYADSFGGHLHEPPLFLDEESGRTPIKGLATKKHTNWQQHVNQEAISTGAGLRPIVQQIALPVLAFVGGPGELHYHSFLGPAYDAFKVPKPLFIPRSQISIISPKVRKKIAAWQLQPDQIVPDMPPPILASMNQQVDDVVNNIGAQINQLTQIPINDNDLKVRVDTGHKQLNKALQKLQQSLERAKRQQQQLPPFGGITQYLFPRGNRQDRVVSLSQALWLYGPGIGETLVNQLEAIQPGAHQFISL